MTNSIIKSSPGAVYRSKIDKNWTMIFISDKISLILGYTSKDFLKDSVQLAQITHPEDILYVENEVHSALEKKTQYELNYRLKHKNNHYVYVWEIGEGVFDLNGNPEFIEGIILDVTEKKLKEEEMRQNLEELSSTQEELNLKAFEMESRMIAINESGIASIEFDPIGNILGANLSFLELMGYTENEIVGKHHQIFVEPLYAESIEYKKFWENLGNGIINRGEFKRITKNGKDVYIKASYSVIRNQAGTVLKILKFATDITSLKLQII